ncbi:MAG: phosphomannomutase/phosphoglucomutase [Bacilli bacterium]|nr:phosphomannomutase/phosphoglucomutase [Bacilli bacterium]
MDYNILRENDIRGEYPNQINPQIAETIGKAFGTYLNLKNKISCVVGHDNRKSGEVLHEALINGLLSVGINVTDIGLSTTPLFNFSCRELKILYGIMVTASHNPSDDNGFKVFGENYLHLNHDELDIFYKIIKEEKFANGNGSLTKTNYQEEYIQMLISKAKITKPLKLVIDAGNGTTSIIVKEVFDKLKIDVEYLNAESDGSFPVHNPDPNDEENLEVLKNKILELKADVGIGFDGDGDRVGIVDEKGNTIPTDILIGIFANEIIPISDNKKVIIDVKCSKALEQEIKRIGGIPMILKNGSAYIETMVYKTPVLIGGEYSGHIFFRDDFDGYDDGIYAGIRFLNILSNTNKKSSETYEHMNKYYNTPEIRINIPDNLKWDIVNKIKNYALTKYGNVNTIDGVRVDYDDGFSLIRCSNTSPCVTLRFEAANEKDLDIRKREFVNLLEYYKKN